MIPKLSKPRIVIAIVIGLLQCSCSLTKKLDNVEKVYIGTTIEIQDRKQGKSIPSFRYNIEQVPKAGTRTGIGNIFIGLHNIYDEVPEKGFKHWIKHRLGEAPIVFDPTLIKNTEVSLSYFLNGKGFFRHQVTCDTFTNKRKVSMQCAVKLNPRYKIDSLVFPVDSTYLSLRLDDVRKRAVLREGDHYDRKKLEYERVRLATLAGELGYLGFRANHVHFFVDTARQQDVASIYTKIIQPTDSTWHSRYFLDSIQIYPNHNLEDTSNADLQVEKVTNTMKVFERNHYVNHDLLDRMILLNPGNPFNVSQQRRSIGRLLDLGLFRFVDFDQTPGPSKNGIIQKILLTPEKMQNVSGEVELNNRSGNFLGTAAQVNYLHRNLFKHAERFTFNIGAQIETQVGNRLSLINSSDFSAGAQLSVPRYLVPFINIREGRSYVPQTVFRADYIYQRRTGFYSLESATGKFGYNWRENSKVYHELYPFSLNEVQVSNQSEEFLDLLSRDARLANSFANTLIGSIQYYLTFSNQLDRSDRKYHYFRTELETSGNLFRLLSGKSRIFGREYSQFARLTLDFRRYLPVGRSNLVGRALVGFGLAYGVSDELPYLRQYFIGGSNSIRAFRIRGLGPGRYFVDPEEVGEFGRQFVDQTGDVKLELNLEARFPIFRYLKGAVFVDAGNVWLLDEPDRPEATFSFTEFASEIAIGTGAGVRLDFDFFLLRLDLAFPLRAPTAANELEWRLKQINPWSRNWRRDNLRLNIGLGYPF